MRSDLDILILAAGLGTRMKSNLAKVLHQLDGRPLVNHVCETALKLSPRKIYVVVGHQADDVKAAVLSDFNGSMFEFPVQQQQLGTGDAVNAYNDVPLANGTQMGPFFEMESVSPGAFLKPGEKLDHRHSIFHFTGDKASLDAIALKTLGSSLKDIQSVFK